MPPYGLRQSIKRKRENESSSSALFNSKTQVQSHKNRNKVTGSASGSQIKDSEGDLPLVGETKRTRSNNYSPFVRISLDDLPQKKKEKVSVKKGQTFSVKKKAVTKSKEQSSRNNFSSERHLISIKNSDVPSTKCGKESASNFSQTVLGHRENQNVSQIITRRRSRSSSTSTVSLVSQGQPEEAKSDSEDCVEVYNKFSEPQSTKKYPLRRQINRPPIIQEIILDTQKKNKLYPSRKKTRVLPLDINTERSRRKSKRETEIDKRKQTVAEDSVLNGDPFEIQVLYAEDDNDTTDGNDTNDLASVESNPKVVSRTVSTKKERRKVSETFSSRTCTRKRLVTSPRNDTWDDGRSSKKKNERSLPSSKISFTKRESKRRSKNKRLSTDSCSVIVTTADVHYSEAITDTQPPKANSVDFSLPFSDEASPIQNLESIHEESKMDETSRQSPDCDSKESSDTDFVSVSDELVKQSPDSASDVTVIADINASEEQTVLNESSDTEDVDASDCNSCVASQTPGITTSNCEEEKDHDPKEFHASDFRTMSDTEEAIASDCKGRSTPDDAESDTLSCNSNKENSDAGEMNASNCNSTANSDTEDIDILNCSNKENSNGFIDGENEPEDDTQAKDVETFSVSSKTESFSVDMGSVDMDIPESWADVENVDVNDAPVDISPSDCDQTIESSLEDEEPAGVEPEVTRVVEVLVDKVESAGTFGNADTSAEITFPEDQPPLNLSNSYTNSLQIYDILIKDPNLLQDFLNGGSLPLQEPNICKRDTQATTEHGEDGFFASFQINVDTSTSDAFVQSFIELIPEPLPPNNSIDPEQPNPQKETPLRKVENAAHKRMNLLELINSLLDGCVLVEKHMSKNSQSLKCVKCCDVFSELRECCDHFKECTANFRPEKVVPLGNIQWVCTVCYSNFADRESLLEHRNSCLVPTLTNEPGAVACDEELEVSFSVNEGNDVSLNDDNMSEFITEQSIQQKTDPQPTTNESVSFENNSKVFTCPACKKVFSCSHESYVQNLEEHLKEHLEDISQKTTADAVSEEGISREEFAADSSEGPQILSVFSVPVNSDNTSTSEKPEKEVCHRARSVASDAEATKAKHNKNHVPNQERLLDSKRRLSLVNASKVKVIRQETSHSKSKLKKSFATTANLGSLLKPIRHSLPLSSFGPNPNTVSQLNTGFCELCHQVLQLPLPGSDSNSKTTFMDGKLCFSSKVVCSGCFCKHKINFSVPGKSIETTYQYHLSSFFNSHYKMSQKGIKQLCGYADRHGLDVEALINHPYSHAPPTETNFSSLQGTPMDSVNSNLSIQQQVSCPPTVSSHFSDPFTLSNCDPSETIGSNILSATSSCQYSPASSSQSPHSGLPEEMDAHALCSLDKSQEQFTLGSNDIQFINELSEPYDAFCNPDGTYVCATCLEPVPEKELAHHFLTQHHRSPMKNTLNLCLDDSLS